jgi:hypothetical protein
MLPFSETLVIIFFAPIMLLAGKAKKHPLPAFSRLSA